MSAAVVNGKAVPKTEDIVHERFLASVDKGDANAAMAHFAFISCEAKEKGAAAAAATAAPATEPKETKPENEADLLATGRRQLLMLLTLRRRQLLVLLCEKGMVKEASDLLANAVASPDFDSRDPSTVVRQTLAAAEAERGGGGRKGWRGGRENLPIVWTVSVSERVVFSVLMLSTPRRTADVYPSTVDEGVIRFDGSSSEARGISSRIISTSTGAVLLQCINSGPTRLATPANSVRFALFCRKMILRRPPFIIIRVSRHRRHATFVCSRHTTTPAVAHVFDVVICQAVRVKTFRTTACSRARPLAHLSNNTTDDHAT